MAWVTPNVTQVCQYFLGTPAGIASIPAGIWSAAKDGGDPRTNGDFMRADRLLAIMLLLQTRGKMKAKTLAEELSVSRRTILRDIEALSISGVPIYAEGGHGGGIALDENYRTNLTGLQEEEARTLFLASNEKLFKQLKLGEAAERTLLKLNAALPTRHQEAVQHIRQRILIDPAWWWQDAQPPQFWEQLQQAVYEERRIRVRYERHDGEFVERTLEP